MLDCEDYDIKMLRRWQYVIILIIIIGRAGPRADGSELDELNLSPFGLMEVLLLG